MACDVVLESDESGPKRKRKREKSEVDEEDEPKHQKRPKFRPWSGERPRLRSPSPVRRNYKNMTRERRIEANARERTRVHTISAAFETLRRAVPSYSHNQKLSKLSVLRVAASYIVTLSRVLGKDYSPDGSAPSLQSCIENVSNTIQMEGKLRKKKDDT
uniref:Net n=1 Tax=Mesovelia mulsanti TaxID=236398 RepID=A0A4U8VIS3_9HEMI|nr:net [Mesovelia mulsanti]VCV25392.1 Net [Mesovelia mulsanti]